MSATLSENQRVIVVPRATKVSQADRDALREAGIIVMTVDDPSQVRMLSPEGPPLTSNQMLRAALVGLAGAFESNKAAAWNALAKIVGSETKT
jgi:hypothetical protein